VGSLGHYRQDADTFAAWGFDAVKVDFCGAGQAHLAPRPLYARFAAALRANATHRRMLLNICNFWSPGAVDGTNPSRPNSSADNAFWAPSIANSWRTDTDIGTTGHTPFRNVLRNLDNDAARPRVAGPGHWNDPDYLAPQEGMTAREARTQLSMWAIVAAPLILGSDPRELSAATIRMLEKRDVIAIDQDPLGMQGKPIAGRVTGQVWVKPLARGDRAVALLNRRGTAIAMATTARAIGLPPAARYRMLNVWSQATSITNGPITARIPPHGAVLYRVSAT
jgi:alpha-galactosidase